MSFLEIIGFAFLGFCAFMAGQGGGGVVVAKTAKIRALSGVSMNIKVFQK